MRIESANDQMIPYLVEIENQIFPNEPWLEKDFQYEIHENPFATIYVLFDENQIIGYCDLWITYEQAQIANIGIRKEYWHKGLGTLLLEYMQNCAIQNECENLTLEVRQSNIHAIQAYEKFGFIKVATRKNYYKNGENADLMIKPLGGLEYDDAVSTRIEL